MPRAESLVSWLRSKPKSTLLLHITGFSCVCTQWQPALGHSLPKAPPQLFQLFISTCAHPKLPKFWHRLMKTPLGCVTCAKHSWDSDAVECLDLPTSAMLVSPDTANGCLKMGSHGHVLVGIKYWGMRALTLSNISKLLCWHF